MRIILFSEVTVFDYNVSTILSPIVGLFNGYWQNNPEDNAEVDLLPIEGGGSSYSPPLDRKQKSNIVVSWLKFQSLHEKHGKNDVKL